MEFFRTRYGHFIFSCFLGAYAFASVWVMRLFLIRSQYINPGIAPFSEMMTGKAIRPYADHILIPALTNLMYHCIPDALEDGIFALLYQLNLLPDYGQSLVLHLITLLIIFAFLLLYIRLMWELARSYFPHSAGIILFAPLLAMLLLPTHLVDTTPMLYDFATLALSAACLLCLQRQRWMFYGICLAAGLLNHWVMLWLIPYAYCTQRRFLPRHFMLIQLLIAACSLSAVQFILYKNSWDLIDFHLSALMESLLSGYSFERFAQILFLTMLATYRWAEKPQPLRYGLVFLALFVIIASGLSMVYEYRLYYSLHPLLILLATHSLLRAGQETITKPQ